MNAPADLAEATDFATAWDTHEADFAANRYQGSRWADTVVQLPGTVPVLFVAAHAVNHQRAGISKPADIGTGGLVCTAATELGAHGLVQAGYASRDANWYDDAHLKQTLRDLLPDVSAVVDVHGMKDSWGVDVCVGSGGAPAGSEHLLEVATEVFSAYGLVVCRDVPFDASRPETVTTFAQQRGAVALQIELARRVRVGSTQRRATFASALAEFVETAHRTL